MTSRLFLTLGDPAGIGPEVVAKALAANPGDVPIVVIGHRPAFEAALRSIRDGAPRVFWTTAPDKQPEPGAIVAIDPDPAGPAITPGKPGPASGRAAHLALDTALKLMERDGSDALVTAPVSKAMVNAAGIEFADHTTWLGAACGREPIMSFVSPKLRVVLATVHIPLSKVPTAHTPASLAWLIVTASRQMAQREHLAGPVRVGVAAINPHAGEGGLFGDDDQRVVAPAIEIARKNELPAEDERIAPRVELTISGPLPGDTVFWRAYDHDDFDIVIAMYHDQGLAAVKTVAFHSAVNATLNLPFVRCSPDHGTAFDRAGTNTADPRSMRAALALARRWLPAP